MQRADEATADVWPEYNRHGDFVNPNWGRMRAAFPDFELVLCDAPEEEVLAQAHSLPLAWDGTAAGLPRGIDSVFEHAFSGATPTALCAMAVEIVPAHQGGGLARRALDAMRRLALAHGLRDLIAPVRPSWKERYPLTPIERYAGWRRTDGLLFDPWMRVHERLGATVVRVEPRSLRITGTVGEWEAWTALPFPETGEYVFPGGLATVAIDREADRGRYWEPNAWMHHALG
ncbi:MAG: hypothetical protein ICV64_04980 [Thermoleophilia bacterium]|nr:hypothetical protein [Thermoleophilia bacterium]